MKIRFTLDPKIDADLIARIQEKANDGRVSEAARFLMRYWHEREKCPQVTAKGQKLTSEGHLQTLESKSDDINLSGLDEFILE